MDKKKSGVGKVIFWALSPIWLILLILLLALAALTFLGYAYDDPAQLTALPPMDVSERYTFHSGERAYDMRLDKSDLFFVMEQGDGLDMDELAAPLSAFGLKLERYGLSFAEEGPSVTARLKAFSFLPLPVKIDLSSEVRSGGNVALTVKKITLARLISASGEKLRQKLSLDADALAFDIDGADIHPRMRQLKDISFEADRMVMTFSIGEELYEQVMENLRETIRLGYFVTDIPALTVLLESDYASDPSGKLGAAFDAILDQCRKDPAYIVTFRNETLAIANAEKADMYLSGSRAAYMDRFLPGVNQETVSALHSAYEGRMTPRLDWLQSLVANLNRLYTHKSLTFTGERFLDIETGEELKLSDVPDPSFAAYADWFDPASARLVLAYGDPDLTYGNEPLSKMPNTGKAALAGFDAKQTYCVIPLMRLADGTRPYCPITR